MPAWAQSCAVRTATRASRGASLRRRASRIRPWRSPRTFRRSRCSTPCSASSATWGATAEAVEKASSGAAYTSRPIDIDILFYDDEVIREERLTVPHPRLAEREFALVPLCEIMRLRRHPVTGETVGGMLEALRKKRER